MEILFTIIIVLVLIGTGLYIQACTSAYRNSKSS